MLRQEILCPVHAMEATLVDRMKDWLREESPWWLCSFAFHVALVCSLAMVGTQVIEQIVEEPIIGCIKTPEPLSSISLIPPDRNTFIDTPEFPPDLTASIEPPPAIEASPVPPDRSGNKGVDGENIPVPRNPGNGEGISIDSPPIPKFHDINPRGPRSGKHDGGGFGDGNPWDGRKQGRNGPIDGRTQTGDQAVRAALNWLSRHQQADGRWSLTAFRKCCMDLTCAVPGKVDSDSAATALALLPFLAAGHTHVSMGVLTDSKDPHKKAIRNYPRIVNNGLYWLLRNQKPNGDLRAGSTMYAHGLATIVLCEVYGMTKDQAVGQAAQRAINFIEAAQNTKTGGWRYQPGNVDPGDTSVVGWQIMALKSGQMAYLRVDPAVLDRAKVFLRSVATGGQFGYTPGTPPTTTMTSVGLLCSQYLGVPRTDPVMMEGTSLLMKSLPDAGPRDVYYLYYATQAMHNQPGGEWDIWNRKMRRTLVTTQEREGCAAGSWNPEAPAADRWGVQGGRLMMTSLAALSLEVYYRYMPLYQLDRD